MLIKRLLGQSLLILVLLLLCAGTLGLGVRWYYGQETRRTLAVQLGLEPTTDWQALEQHLDCDLTWIGMRQQKFETNVKQFGQYYRMNEVGDKIIVTFPSLPFRQRYYWFRDGKLWHRAEMLFGSSNSRPITCSR